MLSARGSLADYFEGVLIKRLAAVDVITDKSNQHEITGMAEWSAVLGSEPRKQKDGNGLTARFIGFMREQDAVTETGFLSWYNARQGKPRRPEWRLYYPSNTVTSLMKANDILILARHRSGEVFFIVAEQDSAMEVALRQLFMRENTAQHDLFEIRSANLTETGVDFVSGFILDEIGVDLLEPETDILDQICDSLGDQLPSTLTMAEAAWQHCVEADPRDGPDLAILAWTDFEDRLFRRFERRTISKRLVQGFMLESGPDVAGFQAFALSIQNRAKSRAGYSLEHHLGRIFNEHRLRYRPQARTENGKSADFLFPGEEAYMDKAYPPDRLVMLGAKSSLKERWRQVLSEADRIACKHLFTLDTRMTVRTFAEMREAKLTLVLPAPVHGRLVDVGAAPVVSLIDFIEHVQDRCGG